MALDFDELRSAFRELGIQVDGRSEAQLSEKEVATVALGLLRGLEPVTDVPADLMSRAIANLAAVSEGSDTRR